VTLPVRFRPEAAADVRAGHAWYDSQRVGLGAKFEAALDADLVLLRQPPSAFPVVSANLRRVLLRRFPYAVYFRIVGCHRDSRRPASSAASSAASPALASARVRPNKRMQPPGRGGLGVPRPPASAWPIAEVLICEARRLALPTADAQLR
jgi:hypothetical protein